MYLKGFYIRAAEWNKRKCSTCETLLVIYLILMAERVNSLENKT